MLWVALHFPLLPQGTLEAIAAWACQFTPRVSLEPPQALLLEVAGQPAPVSAACEALTRQSCASGLEALGFEARARRRADARAPRSGSRAATAQARRGAGRSRMSRRNASFFCRASACRRSASCCACRAKGSRSAAAGAARRARPRARRSCPSRAPSSCRRRASRARLELPAPVTQAEGLLFAARRLLVQLEGFLAARQAGVRGFTLVVLHRRRKPRRIEIGLAVAGARRRAHCRACCARSCRRRSARRAGRGDPARSRRLRAAAGRTRRLFGDAARRGRGLGAAPRAPARAPGRDAVHGLATHPDHRPEHAWRRVEPGEWDPHEFRQPGPRPLWLLETPRRLERRRIRAARRARAHRVGLVGRRRGAPRLLRRPPARRRRWRGSTAKTERLVPAWPVCLNTPSCTASRTSASCAAPRTRRSWSSAPPRSATRRSRITDECSLAGVVRAHVAAKEHGLKLIVGTELRLEDGPKLVLLATDRAATARSAALITTAGAAAEKGSYSLARSDLEAAAPAAGAAGALDSGEDADAADWLAARFRGTRLDRRRAALRARTTARGSKPCSELSQHCGLPLVAAGDVHMHVRSRRRAAGRAHRDAPGQAGRASAATRSIRTPSGTCGCACGSRSSIRRSCWPRPCAIAERCDFSLDELRYEYPEELVPPGETPASCCAS